MKYFAIVYFIIAVFGISAQEAGIAPENITFDSLLTNEPPKVSVSKNIEEGLLTITILDTEDGEVQLSIRNTSSKILHEQSHKTYNGNTLIDLELSMFQSGLYSIKVDGLGYSADLNLSMDK